MPDFDNAPSPESSNEPLVASGAADASVEVSNGSAPAPPTAADLESVTKQRDEYLDLLLRKTAEFDNYRKRVERDRREQNELAGVDVIKELLPIVDNVERALKAADAETSVDAYRRGVELLLKQLLDTLARRGVTTIDPLGETFDPNWHDAVLRESRPEARDGEVTEVFSRGYRLGDRLLRPAMVKVATS
jgi:molecular chaperone GrpE